MKTNKILAVGAFLAAIGFGLDAFGAHALKKILDSQSLEVFKTATKYQQIHAISLVLLGVLMHQHTHLQTEIRRIAQFFLIGILLFSGSLYVISFQKTYNFSVGILGLVTPLGGLFFIGGWLYLAYIFIKRTPQK